MFFPPISKVYPSASKGFHNTIFRCKDTNNNQNCTLYDAVFCYFCTIGNANSSGIPADRLNKKNVAATAATFFFLRKERDNIRCAIYCVSWCVSNVRHIGITMVLRYNTCRCPLRWRIVPPIRRRCASCWWLCRCMVWSTIP